MFLLVNNKEQNQLLVFICTKKKGSADHQWVVLHRSSGEHHSVLPVAQRNQASSFKGQSLCITLLKHPLSALRGLLSPLFISSSFHVSPLLSPSVSSPHLLVSYVCLVLSLSFSNPRTCKILVRGGRMFACSDWLQAGVTRFQLTHMGSGASLFGFRQRLLKYSLNNLPQISSSAASCCRTTGFHGNCRRRAVLDDLFVSLQ